MGADKLLQQLHMRRDKWFMIFSAPIKHKGVLL